MNELQIFNSPEFGELRTVTINNEGWFVALDVANALGYTNPSKAVNDHCKHVKEARHNDSLGRLVTMNVIPEGDLYRLTARSKLPSAEKFEEWIFDEVIPSIRKTGGYTLPQIHELENKASLFDRLTGSYDNKNFRESAKALDISQSQLIGCKMIYKTDGGATLPTQEYKDSGFFTVQYYKYKNSPCTGLRTLITPTGLIAFANMLDAAGLNKTNMKKHGGCKGGNPKWNM